MELVCLENHRRKTLSLPKREWPPGSSQSFTWERASVYLTGSIWWGEAAGFAGTEVSDTSYHVYICPTHSYIFTDISAGFYIIIQSIKDF